MGLYPSAPLERSLGCRKEGFVSTQRALVNGNSLFPLNAHSWSFSQLIPSSLPQPGIHTPPYPLGILNAVSLPPSPPSSVRGHAHTHALTRMYAHSHQKEGRKVLFRQMSKFPFPHCSSQSGHCLAPPVVMSLVNYILY